MADCENSISPKEVRYIKLGRAGTLERHCIQNGYCYIGFGTGDPACFELVVKAAQTKKDADWKKVWEYTYRQDKTGSEQAKKFRASTACNQLRSFYESDERTLWITFSSSKLYYAFLDVSAPAVISPEHGGSFRPVQAGGWSCHAINGEELHEDNLSGQLVQTKSFQGTSCRIKENISDYLIRRITGQLTDLQVGLEEVRSKTVNLLGEAIRNLGPQDFEILVDLIFSSGWKRLTGIGGQMATKDMVYEDGLNSSPNASCRICVQVKTRTNLSQFHKYIGQFESQPYDRFFYVFHTSKESPSDFVVPENIDTDLTIWSCDDVTYQVIRCGLVDWVLNKSL